MPKLSEAAGRLEGQKMFQILAKTQEMERQGKKIIHFEIGDPDFDTPKNIADACYYALKKGDTHYTNSMGLLDFRVAAAEVTERSRGFKPDIGQLLVTAGANVQIYYALKCAVNPGDEVITPDPAFVSYVSIMNMLNIKPVKVPLREENEFRINPDDIEKSVTEKTRMIIINSPNNPTGSVMTEDEMKRVYEIAEKNDLYLLSDEVYARMIYADTKTKFCSPSRYDHCNERTIVVNGFSKSYAMTGWRLGVVTGPSELIAKMGLVLETTSSCVSPFIQRAGIEALTGSQEPIFEMVNEFRKRRDVIVSGLNTLPDVRCVKPKGAFYAFPNIRSTGMTSQQFTDLMLEEAGVAVAPGTIFGENGEGYVRLCYANSLENIGMGIERMRYALKNSNSNGG